MCFAGSPNGIECLHRAHEYLCFCWLATLMWEPTEELRLYVRPDFIKSAQHVLFVLLRWFERWGVSVCTVADLWAVASRIPLKRHAVPFGTLCLSFYPITFLISRWCSDTIVLTQ